MEALSAHYGSPGRLADYQRRFERTTRTSGEDPSIFTTSLETLAIKAFGDMGQTARLRIIRNRFIAGHSSCGLRRHLDSVYMILLIDAGFGRVMRTWMFGGPVNRDPTRHIRPMRLAVPMGGWMICGWRRSLAHSLCRISWRLCFGDCWLVRLHRLRPRSRSPLQLLQRLLPEAQSRQPWKLWKLCCKICFPGV